MADHAPDGAREAVRALNSTPNNGHEQRMVSDFIDLWSLFNEALDSRGYNDIDRADRISLFAVYASNYGMHR